MGTFSIWHWVIVLVFFGLPILAVYRENSSERLLRIGFLKWIGIYVGIPILFNFVARLLLVEGGAVLGIALLIGLILVYPFYQRVVRRARDAGMGKGIAYLTIVPLVSLFTILILLFKSSIDGEKIEADGTEQPIRNTRSDKQKVTTGAKELGGKHTVASGQKTDDLKPTVGEETLEEAQAALEKALEDLTVLKEKNVLDDREFGAAKLRAQASFGDKKRVIEQRNSEEELRNSEEELHGELLQIIGNLTTLHNQGVLDDAGYETARQRTLADFVKRGAKDINGAVEEYKGVSIVRKGDKFVVDGNEYNSINTAKAYIEHYKS